MHGVGDDTEEVVQGQQERVLPLSTEVNGELRSFFGILDERKHWNETGRFIILGHLQFSTQVEFSRRIISVFSKTTSHTSVENVRELVSRGGVGVPSKDNGRVTHKLMPDEVTYFAIKEKTKQTST